jgi:signal transduction histidine kinase
VADPGGQLPPDFKLVHFEAVLEEAVHHVAQLARDRQVEVIRDIEGVTEPIRTDLAKITEVMTELIGNAVKFTSGGPCDRRHRRGPLRLPGGGYRMGSPPTMSSIPRRFYQVDDR